MKTVIIGAGAGGRAVLELYDQGRLSVLNLSILAVVDQNPDAPGMRFARQKGWPTLGSVHTAMALPELELVIEVTGDHDLLEDIYFLSPPGTRVIDHELARIFWDLERVSQNLQEELNLKEEMAQRYTQILDAVHAAITIKDLEGRFVQVNPRALRLLGVPKEELIGRTARDVLGQQTGQRIEQLDRSVTVAAGNQVAEEIHTIGGTEHVLISERFPLYDYQGEPVGICCVSREVTRERRLQRELVQTERLVAVGKLAAGVAHELNNPLTGILTFAEDLLLDAAPDDPRREDYQTIVNEAMRCRTIVRDLLDFSRRKAPRPQRVDLGPVVEQTVSLVARQASFHDVTITVGTLGALPRVNIDAQQIQQAILNLLINARDAMDGRGEITIAGFVSDARKVVLSVSDTGPGISAELRAKVFEPFFSTKGEQGNGLGLPTVVSVMDQHGGTVDLDEGQTTGAAFRLHFPLIAEGN